MHMNGLCHVRTKLTVVGSLKTILARPRKGSLDLDLDLDLDNSRQSPAGYHGDEVCTPTGMSEWSAGF